MNLIVAVDNNWGIGSNNGLLYSLKQDMAYFREKTMNKIIQNLKNVKSKRKIIIEINTIENYI